MPRGGWLREVRRWACCGLWRTGGPSPGFWGVFIIAVHRAFVLDLGGWGPGIAVLWSCQRIDVCDSVRLLYLLTYLRDQVIREDPAGAVVVRAWPGHRRIGRGSCRSTGVDGVGTPVHSSGTGGSEAL